MADKQMNPSFQVVVDYLKKHPAAPYADVKAVADKAGHTIYPIVYGRAKAYLGLVESQPRGRGKAASAKKAAVRKAASAKPAAPKAPVTRRRGRPAKAAAPTSAVGSLDAVLAHIRGVERERDQLRSALDKIRTALDTALASK